MKSDNANAVTGGQDPAPTVYAGGTFTYHLKATNSGNDAAANATITDALPAGLTSVSATDGGTATGNTVSWNLGTLAAGASKQVAVTVKVDAGVAPGAVFANTAVISSPTHDPNGGNNTNTENTQVAEPGSISGIAFKPVVGNLRDGRMPDSVFGGMTVELLDADGAVVATTTTATNGTYSFDPVAPGTYKVKFGAPADRGAGGGAAGPPGPVRASCPSLNPHPRKSPQGSWRTRGPPARDSAPRYTRWCSAAISVKSRRAVSKSSVTRSSSRWMRSSAASLCRPRRPMSIAWTRASMAPVVTACSCWSTSIR
ncbi:MAG: DUF11 domain-containing protein [Acetobacteraceae bacterium]|nr:DUF11 domain-containing protein [Acetobacteraceae bacterium]